jgi:Uma2 family endonuclease
MATVRTRYRFTVDEFHRMAAAGVFTEDERVELLEGEITVMSPIGDRHVAAVDFLNDRFGEALRGRALVRVQSPVRLSAHTAPQPDLALLRRSPDYYRTTPATARDVFLVIEVADTSLEYDRAKLSLYAEAGVPETWIVDLQGERLEVHRDPRGARYERTLILQRGETVAPEAFPDVALATVELFG